MDLSLNYICLTPPPEVGYVPFKFSLSAEGLEVKPGSWGARRICCRGMGGVEPGFTFWNEYWGNFRPCKFITIRRKSGLVRNFLISPPDSDKFIAELRPRAGSSQDNWRGLNAGSGRLQNAAWGSQAVFFW